MLSLFWPRSTTDTPTIGAGVLCLIVLIGMGPAISHAEAVTSVNCAAELDAAVALASNPDNKAGALERRFAALEIRCPAFAQMAHNQGVLAAKDNRWPLAVAHFERALKKDKRAADTHQHLQQIFKFRAAQAYSRALNTPLSAEPPSLDFQDSGNRNAEPEQQFPEYEHLRNMATVEYELYAWWQSLRNWTHIRNHYIDRYDIEAIKLSRQQHLSQQWSDTRREIAFTENDAIVVLSDTVKAHTLLLMRLVGARWKIYQETRL